MGWCSRTVLTLVATVALVGLAWRRWCFCGAAFRKRRTCADEPSVACFLGPGPCRSPSLNWPQRRVLMPKMWLRQPIGWTTEELRAARPYLCIERAENVPVADPVCKGTADAQSTDFRHRLTLV